MTKELIRLRDLYHEANALHLKLSAQPHNISGFVSTTGAFLMYMRTAVVLDKARMRRDRRRAAFARAYSAEAARAARRQIFPPCPLVAHAIAEHGIAILTPEYRARIEGNAAHV